jgi:crossover junction endodeoxyribonuclease RuvC
MGDSKLCVVGIDPGLDGGIALIVLGKLGEVGELWVQPMPTKPAGTTASGRKSREVDCTALAQWIDTTESLVDCKIQRVAVELVHAMPKQGVTSMFNFGKAYGSVLGVLGALRHPVLHVTPQIWKKSILDGLGRDKNDSIRFAMSLFPKETFLASPACRVPHDGMAEATCLAEYARREVLGYVGHAQKMGGRSKKLLAPDSAQV